MDGGRLWQPGRTRLTRRRLAVWNLVAGTLLDAATVIVCSLDAVSVQQAIAMALPAGLLTAGGMIALLVPDPWAAWRRGFRQGCEAAFLSRHCPEPADVTRKSSGKARLTSSGSAMR